MDILKTKRIIIKVGSALLVDSQTGEVKKRWLRTLCDDVAWLRKQGKEVLVVSSGAVGLGVNMIGKESGQMKLEEKQAAAACGQTILVQTYQEAFKKHKINAAQVLVTIQDSESRRRYLNARNTLETLLNNNILPIINENDTVATNELRFGDNDRLAARVAQMTSADLVIILSDIDGLYTANPKLNQQAEHIDEVTNITDDIKAMAGQALSGLGSGGMITKLAAAEIALQSGCHMIIGNGNKKNPVRNIINGGKATLFHATETPIKARKNWIAHRLNVKGDIIIDEGAHQALKKGNSLLPAGVIDIQGKFKRGDAVTIKTHRMKPIARGLVAYSSKDAKVIAGHQSSEIGNLVGFTGRNELIHRDDLVMLEDPKAT